MGDPQEVNGIVSVFCQSKRDPLLMGSTKSNMGHPEPASGLAAMAKVSVALSALQTSYFSRILIFTAILRSQIRSKLFNSSMFKPILVSEMLLDKVFQSSCIWPFVVPR